MENLDDNKPWASRALQAVRTLNARIALHRRVFREMEKVLNSGFTDKTKLEKVQQMIEQIKREGKL